MRRSSSIYGSGSGALAFLSCDGRETNLTQCSTEENTVCDHSEDAGVKCGGMLAKHSMKLPQQ